MSSIQNAYQSLPARGAWIEIPWRVLSWDGGGSLPARGAWIEMTLTEKLLRMERSLPARGAWIEISYLRYGDAGDHVAPREGSVD